MTLWVYSSWPCVLFRLMTSLPGRYFSQNLWFKDNRAIASPLFPIKSRLNSSFWLNKKHFKIEMGANRSKGFVGTHQCDLVFTDCTEWHECGIIRCRLFLLFKLCIFIFRFKQLKYMLRRRSWFCLQRLSRRILLWRWLVGLAKYLYPRPCGNPFWNVNKINFFVRNRALTLKNRCVPSESDSALSNHLGFNYVLQRYAS